MDDLSADDNRSGIQVIARAAAVLRALKDNFAGMSLAQIAGQVALPWSTVQRIVGALQDERLVIASGTGGGIKPGPELSVFAQATRYNMVESCRLFLSELADEMRETADLGVRERSFWIRCRAAIACGLYPRWARCSR